MLVFELQFPILDIQPSQQRSQIRTHAAKDACLIYEGKVDSGHQIHMVKPEIIAEAVLSLVPMEVQSGQ